MTYLNAPSVSRDAHPVVRLLGNDMGGRSRTRLWIGFQKLFNALLNPGGVLVFTTQGHADAVLSN
ncbi:MAG: hypothetical protein GDA43_09970 [Hormoscilla sp. SP5CHS1]|nr:hypothetical protein [Hormoscilla sp. SP5CHS1]